MMTYIQLKHAQTIQQFRHDYLRNLVAPMDGMWEGAVIAQATFWEIQDQGRFAGYFCLDTSTTETTLLRFQLAKNYLARSQEIFQELILSMSIQQAIASTLEPFYFSLCLDIQKNIVPHSYLFRDNIPMELAPEHSQASYRKAHQQDLEELIRFYLASTEGPGTWIEAFLRRRIEAGELFVLSDQQRLLATGECIPSVQQPPFADLGMVVARSARGRGLGTSMLIRLKKQCHEMGLIPICSCEATNHASKKAIEKAGFISEHRMVRFAF